MRSIKPEIKKTLSSLNADDIKVRRHKQWITMVLIVSYDFEGERVMSRINRVLKLLEEKLPKKVYDSYFFQVEPVTHKELSQRLYPWPK